MKPEGKNHALSSTPASGAEALAYWDCKAKTYPGPKDAGAADKARYVQQCAADLGVLWNVPAVLDAGAGTGSHALAMAWQAQRVVAVDLSAAMLEPLKISRPPNVEVIAGDLLQLDMKSLGWEKAFDLAWCCMSPISGDMHGIAQLELASRGQVCCVTWGTNRNDPLFCEAFLLHGERFYPPAWRDTIMTHAKQSGRTLRYRVMKNNVTQRFSVENFVLDLAHHLRWLGIEPDHGLLLDWASSISDDGVITRHLVADQEIWLWSVNPD